MGTGASKTLICHSSKQERICRADQIALIGAHGFVVDLPDPIHFSVWSCNVAVKGDPHGGNNFSHAILPSLLYSNVLSCGENARTSHGIARVWPSPGKEPRKDVMSAILISIHHESTLSTAIRSLVERHRLFMPTATTHF